MKRLKGLFKDSKPIDQPEGTYYHLLNGIVNKQLGSITNEKDSQLFSSLNTGYDVVGHIVIEEEVVIFTTNGTTSKIQLIDYKGTLTTILTSTLLNFSLEYPIMGVYSINTVGERLIYFTDGLNNPRFLNIDNHSITDSNLYLTNLFLSTPKSIKLEFTGHNSTGGNLTSGVYFVAASYMTSDYDSTNVEVLSNPIYLTPDTEATFSQFDGAEAGFASTKTINITLSNLDINYNFVQLYLICKENGILKTVRKLPILTISTSTLSYSITGNESYTDTTIDILIPKASYESAKAITQVDDSLYLGNVTTQEDIGFQKYANSIIVEAVTEVQANALTVINDSYKGDLNQKKSYQRDEIYAFYISFLLKNGNRSLAYHIPGRETVNNTLTDGYIEIPEALPSNIIPGIPAASTEGFAISQILDEGTVLFDIKDSSHVVQYAISVSVTNGDTIPLILDSIASAIEIGTSGNFTFDENGIDSGSLKASNVGTAYNGYYIDNITQNVITTNGFGNNTTGGTDPYEALYTDAITILPGINVSFVLTAGDSVSTIRTKILDALNSAALDFTFALDANPNRISISSSNTISVLSTYTNDSLLLYTYLNNDVVGELDTFKEVSNPLANGMGYWENENETYPNNENFDIWTIDESGNGIATNNTLRNKPVRHHHFPEHQYNNFYDGTNIRTLGFKLTNLKIPNDIAEQVVGYEVYRAKRDETIIGQGNLLFQILSDGIIARNVGYESDLDNTPIATINDFHLMRTNKSISQIETAKIICYTTKNIVGVLDSVRGNYDFLTGYTNYTDPGYPNLFIDISAKARIPLDTELVLLNSLGFDQDFQNYRGDSTIALQTNVSTQEHRDVLKSCLVNLKTNKVNLYNSFFSQPLLWTGYKDISLDNFTIIGGVGGRTQYESETIYGGDVFIQKYSHTQHGKNRNWDSVISTKYTVLTNIVECRDNIGLRHEGVETYQKYYPKTPIFSDVLNPDMSAYSAPFDYYDKTDGWYGYNQDYSQEGDFVQVGIFNPLIKNVTDYSNRVIRSSGDSLGNINNYRNFLLEDKLDLPRSKGAIINLENLDNNLLIHTDRTLFVTRGKEELVTDDIRTYIGSGDIFSNYPKEIFSLKYGYGGLQHPFSAISTQFGYFFVDQLSRKVYQFAGELKEISFDGMRNEFLSLLPYNYKISNPNPKYIGISLGYDSVQSRILITKRDRKLKFGIILSQDDDMFSIFNYTSTVNVPIYDNTYFEDDHHTYSFVPDINNWVSKHSYYPYQYFSLRDKFLSISNDENINRHHVANTFLPFEFGFVENSNPTELKQAININLLYELMNNGLRVLEPLTSYQMSTSYQDSGEIALIPFPSADNNTRNKQNRWFISKFRDMLVNGVLDPNKVWYDRRRMLDNYFKVLITYNGQKNLYLYESQVEYDKG